MTRAKLETLIEDFRGTGSSEDALVADHIEDVIASNESEPWGDVLDSVRNSLEEVRSAATCVLERLTTKET